MTIELIGAVLEKPTGPLVLKKFSAFCGTRRFIASCIKACYLFFLFGAWLSLYVEFLSPRLTPELEGHPLSYVRDC